VWDVLRKRKKRHAGRTGGQSILKRQREGGKYIDREKGKTQRGRVKGGRHVRGGGRTLIKGHSWGVKSGVSEGDLLTVVGANLG